MEAGGYATTRGVRFQALWAARQLLHLLAEELASVRIEPAGTEGEGVDLIVTLPDGRTEYQQCKRSNRQVGKWTLGELLNRGVLGATHARLRGDPTATILLVSVDAAPALRDLAESARASLDPESFFRDQVRASNERLTAFQDFCKFLGLNSESPGDLELARDRLQNHAGSLVPFASCILAVCRSLSATASAEEGSHQSTSWEGGYYLPGILLRLYEQAQDEEIRETCLDAWDLLLQARVVAAIDLSRQLAAEE